MNYLKAILAIALVSAIFAGGHIVASNAGELKLSKERIAWANERTKFEEERTKFEEERTSWADEKAAMSAAAVSALDLQIKEAQAKENEMRKAHRSAEARYLKRIKELENERNEMDTIIADNSPTGGLWINVEAASCPRGAEPGTNLRQATGGSDRFAPTLRCRIAETDAKALVQISDTSDKRTELLNKCIATLNGQTDTLSPIIETNQ